MRTSDERSSNLNNTLETLRSSVSTGLRVAMPGIIQKWDKVTQTATVQLSIKEKVINAGAEKDTKIPLLVDVPVVMPRAGGYILAFAPKAGDEVLVIFADMCIDAWWQSGGVQTQAEIRRHDLSDSFAVFGTWSQKRKPLLPDSGVRLQDDNGSAGVSINSGTVNLFGHVTVNGATLAVGGDSF